jgi:hypothetical protein
MITATLRQARTHAREALRLLEAEDQHSEDCDCNRCYAVGELRAALHELKALQQQDEVAA